MARYKNEAPEHLFDRKLHEILTSRHKGPQEINAKMLALLIYAHRHKISLPAGIRIGGKDLFEIDSPVVRTAESGVEAPADAQPTKNFLDELKGRD